MKNENYVLLFLINPDGKLLLQHRDDDAPTYPGYWGFFGGAIEVGETSLEAIRREAYEELRYSPQVKTPTLVVEYSDALTHRFGKKYYFVVHLKENPILDLQEGQGMRWLGIDECEGLKISDYNRQKICELMEISKAK